MVWVTRVTTKATGRKTLPLVAFWTPLALWTACWAWIMWPNSTLSWHFSVDGAGLLFHGSGLNPFAHAPWLQTGPLSLLVAVVLSPLPANTAKNIALVAMTAAGPLLVAAIAPLVAPARRARRLFIAAIVLVPAWTVLWVRWGTSMMSWPWSSPLWPCAPCMPADPSWPAQRWPWPSPPSRGQSGPSPAARPGVESAACGARGGRGSRTHLGALRAGQPAHPWRPSVGLSPASGLHTLGARGVWVPRWGRTAQLLLAPAAATVAALSRGLPGVLLVSIAVRLALDPKNNAYYIGSATLAAVAFDLLGTSWTIPWTRASTVARFWAPFVATFNHALSTTTGLTHWWFAHQQTVGAIHLAWAVAVIALVLGWPRRPAHLIASC